MGNVIPKPHFIIIICIIFSFVPSSFSATKRDTKQAQDYRDKGYEAQSLGNLDMALGYYQRAIEADPYYAIAYNDMGVLLEAKGINDRAKDLYLRAISLDPDYLSVYYNLAALYEKEGDLNKAAYYWRTRVNLGDWSDVWTWKAQDRIKTLETSGVLDAEDMSMSANLGLSVTPNPSRDAKYHMYRGRQYLAIGNHLAALKEFNAAIVIDPYNEEIEELLEDAQLKVLLHN